MVFVSPRFQIVMKTWLGDKCQTVLLLTCTFYEIQSIVFSADLTPKAKGKNGGLKSDVKKFIILEAFATNASHAMQVPALLPHGSRYRHNSNWYIGANRCKQHPFPSQFLKRGPCPPFFNVSQSVLNALPERFRSKRTPKVHAFFDPELRLMLRLFKILPMLQRTFNAHIGPTRTRGVRSSSLQQLRV